MNENQVQEPTLTLTLPVSQMQVVWEAFINYPLPLTRSQDIAQAISSQLNAQSDALKLEEAKVPEVLPE